VNFWLARKIIFRKNQFKDPTTFFSIAGITLGVAFLVVVMASFSGFVTTMQKSIVDVWGDVGVYKRGGGLIKDPQAFEKRIKKIVPEIQSAIPYVNVKCMVANKGRLNSVLLTGIDWEKSKSVLALTQRIVDSPLPGAEVRGIPAYLGKEVARKLGLKGGDTFRGIVLRPKRTSVTGVEPTTESFHVAAVIDFGKFEFNDKFMLSDLATVQQLGQINSGVNGFRIRLRDSDLAVAKGQILQEQLGFDFGVMDWTQAGGANFLAAIEYEKMVLFFVMCVMIVAAFFNVSTTLFLNVMRRYSQISILKTLGLRKRSIILIFCANGLFLGLVGLTLGLSLGIIFCYIFDYSQRLFTLMPESVYKVSYVVTTIDWKDTIMIVVATLIICIIATLGPAFRGAKLPPVEGLKYE